MSTSMLKSAVGSEVKDQIQSALVQIAEVMVALSTTDEVVAMAHLQASSDALHLSLCRFEHDND